MSALFCFVRIDGQVRFAAGVTILFRNRPAPSLSDTQSRNWAHQSLRIHHTETPPVTWRPYPYPASPTA